MGPMHFRNKAWSPALLSLGLPGLGQLYQKRFPAAFVFFAAFLGALSGLHSSRWIATIGLFGASALLWAIALCAGLEALRRDRESSDPPSPSRGIAYLLTASCGFLFWFGEAGIGLLPYQASMRVSIDVERLVREIQLCTQKRGAPPEALERCERFSTLPRIDPWGEPYRYVLSDSERFELASAGEDRRWGSADDRIYRFRH